MGLRQRREMVEIPAILVDQIVVSYYPHKILLESHYFYNYHSRIIIIVSKPVNEYLECMRKSNCLAL